jgi:2-octaprenyl-6-methoxyphenol hydroxylase
LAGGKVATGRTVAGKVFRRDALVNGLANTAMLQSRMARTKKTVEAPHGEPDRQTGAVDVLIAGGGHVGLCTGLAIAQAAPRLQVAVVDPQPPESGTSDRRASAVAAAAVRMLRRLGVWDKIAAEAQPIHRMIVTDSRTQDAVRPVFLTFGEAPGEGEPFAYMVANAALVGEMRAAAQRVGVELRRDSVANFTHGEVALRVELASGTILNARLLVAADGVRSRLRELAGIRTLHWPYRQSGIVVTVRHERDHEGVAEEHFLPAGPFAILPLKDRRSSLVWTESPENATRLVEGDPFVFQSELERRFGYKLGELAVEDKPRAYPLGLTLARDFVRQRFALVGDAAHGIHPIAGQGLNLGFKDAAALAETVVEAHRLGLDVGSLSTLERYQMWRRFDTVQMGVVTDVLNRLFSNDISIIRMARDLGLSLVDRLPGLKARLIRQAAGNGAAVPRLLAGEAI